MGMNKDQLVLDTAALAESDNVGAYIRASDGTLITHTSLSAGTIKALDVNVANDINVTLAAGASVKITDGTDDLAVNADGSINVAGTVELGATTLAALETITVTATDLDIRNLVFATDTVDASGSVIKITDGTNQLVVNADGSINANVDVSVTTGSDKAEDAAHSSGDVGTYILSVREDVLSASASAPGDYQSIKTDALGRTYVNSSAQTAAFSAVAVDSTVGGTDLVATDLVNRKKILIQNTSSKSIYIGNSGVTTATGIKLPASSSAEFEVSDNCNLFAITASGSADVRIMEVA